MRPRYHSLWCPESKTDICKWFNSESLHRFCVKIYSNHTYLKLENGYSILTDLKGFFAWWTMLGGFVKNWSASFNSDAQTIILITESFWWHRGLSMTSSFSYWYSSSLPSMCCAMFPDAFHFLFFHFKSLLACLLSGMCSMCPVKLNRISATIL